MHTQPTGSHEPQHDQTDVNNWLHANALPLHHLEAGNSFADLMPLKALLADAKVVGLGETTHGTREIFQLKHRLVEFLVVELGFNAIAFEASFAGCQPINDYILHGSDNRDAALTGQGYVVWDIEEIVALLDWLRAHNDNLPNDKKVLFYGLDLWNNDLGRRAVLDYLLHVAPDQAAVARPLFEAMTNEEAKWPTLMDGDARRAIGTLLPQFQSLIDHMEAHSADYIRRSSHEQFSQTYRFLRVMQQWLIANGPEHLVSPAPRASARSAFMAENLIHLINQAAHDAKFIVWEHNWHISKGGSDTDELNMGRALQQEYGERYFAMGFEYGQGACNTRILLPDRRLGDLKEVTFGPPPQDSLPWLLSQAHLGNLILDLRALSERTAVEGWLRSPLTLHHVSWVYSEDSEFYLEYNIRERYDAIAYIEQTTGARPTVNGMKTIAARQGL
jgi:erythromycin esterase